MLTLNPIYVCNPSTKKNYKNLFLLNELRIYETTTHSIWCNTKANYPKNQKSINGRWCSLERKKETILTQTHSKTESHLVSPKKIALTHTQKQIVFLYSYFVNGWMYYSDCKWKLTFRSKSKTNKKTFRKTKNWETEKTSESEFHERILAVNWK